MSANQKFSEPVNTVNSAAIRAILAETDDADILRRRLEALLPAPTMADVEWDDDAHAGLCAESTDDGVVRMIGLDCENGHTDHIMCYLRPGAFDSLPMRSLTPIPGTRLDLTPRRDHVDPPTPDHPTALTTEEDYQRAPEGTVAATEGGEAWTKRKSGLWEMWGVLAGYNNYGMADEARQVLRWGETL